MVGRGGMSKRIIDKKLYTYEEFSRMILVFFHLVDTFSALVVRFSAILNLKISFSNWRRLYMSLVEWTKLGLL
jgi:hypothetical protein